jgi:hypothetical protein
MRPTISTIADATRRTAKTTAAPQNAIGEPVLQPTPLSPDFDPLGFPEGRPAPSGFGGSLHPCCSEERRQVSRLLGCVGPKAHATLRFCSVRMIRRPSSLRPLHANGPKAFSASRLLWSVRPKTPLPRLDPPEPPEGASSFTIAPPRSPGGDPNLAPVHQFDPKIHQAFRFGRRGRARSSEESQHSRPPAASQSLDAEAPAPCVCRLVAFPVSPFDGRHQRLSAATHDRFARKRVDRVRAISDALSDRLACALQPGSAGADVPTSKSSSSPCGSNNALEDQAFEQSADFSANRPHSRCHQAVTESDSRQALTSVGSLWITWISCTATVARSRLVGQNRRAMKLCGGRGRYACGIDSKQREFRHA